MRIRLAKEMGFCFGVKRAVSLVEDIAGSGKPVFVLGSLVHNPQVVQDLASRGVTTVDSMDSVPRGTLVIPSHGASPDVASLAQERGISVLDATCPFVRVVQKAAEELAGAGYKVLVLGDREHTEVKGIVAWAHGNAVVLGAPEEVDRLELRGRIGVVAQTTQTVESLRDLAQRIVGSSLDQLRDLRVVNTICGATAARQTAALDLANEVELILVVGGRTSANTRRLLEICRSQGCTAYQIETADEIKAGWLAGVEELGITAGASTPDGVVDGVVARVLELSGK